MQFGRPRLDLDRVTGPPVRQRGSGTVQAQSAGQGRVTRTSSQTAAPSVADQSLTAFRPLRSDGPFRGVLTRGRAVPLDEAEQVAAMEAVTRDVYAATTLPVQEAKMRTVRSFLACWNLPLVPYTPEVVYALGAALKWRGYRSADLYLYLSRAVAEREGAVIGPAARRALTDVIRSC